MSREQENRLFIENIQMGCFCVDNVKMRIFTEQIINDMGRHWNTLQGASKDEAFKNDQYLINCGLIEMLFYLYRSQIYLRKVCNGLDELVKNLSHKQKDLLEETLLAGAFCGCPFASYASIKTLVEFNFATSLHHNFRGCSINVYSKLATSLQSIDHQSIITLSIFEKAIAALKTTGSSSETENQECKVIQTEPTNLDLDLDIMYEVIETHISIPLLLRQVTECKYEWRDEAVHTLLRVLLMGIQNCVHIKQSFLNDYEPLFILLLTTPSLLVFERCCTLLKEIIDYKSTITKSSFVDEKQMKVAYVFLQNSSSMTLIQVMSDNKSNGVHSFGGPSVTNDSTEFDVIPADQPCFRSFLLVYLSSLSTACAHICNKSENSDNLKQILIGLVDVEKLWKLKISSVTNPLTLFEDQDDQMLEILLYSLEIYLFNIKPNKRFGQTLQFFEPHTMFFNFMQIIRMDYQVLLDLLISEETCFLLYFIKYLKLVLGNFDEFINFHPGRLCSPTLENESCTKMNNVSTKLVNYESSDEESSEESSTDIKLNNTYPQEISEVFKKLSTSIEKQVAKKIFPYNISPLLKLLRKFILDVN